MLIQEHLGTVAWNHDKDPHGSRNINLKNQMMEIDNDEHFEHGKLRF